MNNDKRNLSLLIEYFQNGCKKNCVQQLGLEMEHFVVDQKTKESISYYGERGIAHLLERMRPSYSRVYYEGNQLLGLYNNDYSLTLEPAAQLEISINPDPEISWISSVYQNFRRQIAPILEEWGYELVTIGYQPKSCVQDLTLIPKKRYAYMDAYFKTSGTMGANMMRGTASAQISVDYYSERDFVRKIRAAYLLMPAIKFLTDCSPIFEGKPSPGRMMRTQIWNQVDPVRCGIVPNLFSHDFGFETYARYLMQLPLIFIPQGEDAIPVGDQTAADLWKKREFSETDIEHILSMAFPDVRLKRYLEIRGADCMPFSYVTGYLALLKGIFFHEDALDEILRIQADTEKILQAENSLMEKGFEGMIYGMTAEAYLKRILTIAEEHLRGDEQCYLEPLKKIVKEKRSLAEQYEK